LNQKFVLQNLAEAADHLNAAIEAARDGDPVRFETWIPWVYLKLNAAWNSRELAEEESMNLDSYKGRCRLPTDLDEFFDA
jgi:hypothetical protein